MDGLFKTFPGGVHALTGLSLEVRKGELMVLVGASGCGKTTTLRILAGLERPDAGRVLLDGEDQTALPPRRRDVAMVFQHPALYPHLCVRRNLGFALALRGTPRAEIGRRVQEAAAMLGIEDLLDRRPRTLSGGQQQRVALGKAIVRRPRLFLLDEPLSSLDGPLRARMRLEIRRLQARLGVTTVLVTHDAGDAMMLGHRVAVLWGGRVRQVDSPQTLLRRPADRQVAALIGSPPMNLLEGRLQETDAGLRFRCARIALAVPEPWRGPLREASGGPIVLGVRPEHLVLVPGIGRAHAAVEAVEPAGPDNLVHLFAAGQPLVARVDPRQAFCPGQQVDLSFAPGSLHFFSAATGAAIPAPPAQPDARARDRAQPDA